jgi:hypothetical protein
MINVSDSIKSLYFQKQKSSDEKNMAEIHAENKWHKSEAEYFKNLYEHHRAEAQKCYLKREYHLSQIS